MRRFLHSVEFVGKSVRFFQDAERGNKAEGGFEGSGSFGLFVSSFSQTLEVLERPRARAVGPLREGQAACRRGVRAHVRGRAQVPREPLQAWGRPLTGFES